MAGRRADWVSLGFDTWLLGLEAAQVVWLRGWRLAAGDARAEREARLMIDEKIAAYSAFCWSAATGGAGSSPEAVARSAVRHYGRKVRANRRRLGS